MNGHNDLMFAIELAALALLGIVLIDAHDAGRVQLGPRAAPATGRCAGGRLLLFSSIRSIGSLLRIAGHFFRRRRGRFGAARTH